MLERHRRHVHATPGACDLAGRSGRCRSLLGTLRSQRLPRSGHRLHRDRAFWRLVPGFLRALGAGCGPLKGRQGPGGQDRWPWEPEPTAAGVAGEVPSGPRSRTQQKAAGMENTEAVGAGEAWRALGRADCGVRPTKWMAEAPWAGL